MATWSAADIGDQAGRIVVVTGASSGLGLAAAGALTLAGATVVLACRNLDKGEQARRALGAPERTVVAPLDLAQPASIAAFGLWFAGRYGRLDLLVNNAGVMATPAALTADGIELQWATNHLGHFTLTGRLLEPLLATERSRVVTVSSLAASSGRLSGYDPTTLDGYRRLEAYARSKLANLVFTAELDRRLRARAATTIAVAAHPGITHTNLATSFGSPLAGRAVRAISRFAAQPVTVGVLPILRAATDPCVEGGEYYGPAGRSQRRGRPVRVAIPPGATDPGAGELLWRQSASLAGFDYLADPP
jgi:NAD(P)-dependent dehydrogenase (short-subunit alcohol dehydrogenase family)